MSGHGPHESQPGYSAGQVLSDGCAECAARSASPWMAISHMDPQTFSDAWVRAVAFEQGQVDDVSRAEIPVLRILWAVAYQFNQRGFPLGPMPGPFDIFTEVPL